MIWVSARRALGILAVLICAADLSLHLFPLQQAFSQTSPYARFAGSWDGHGRELFIGPGGNGWYRARTYTWCSGMYATSCDKLTGGIIFAGGFGTFALSRVKGNTAYGVITNSSLSWQFHNSISIVRSKNNTLTMVTAGPFNDSTFCSPKSPPGWCGA